MCALLPSGSFGVNPHLIGCLMPRYPGFETICLLSHNLKTYDQAEKRIELSLFHGVIAFSCCAPVSAQSLIPQVSRFTRHLRLPKLRITGLSGICLFGSTAMYCYEVAHVLEWVSGRFLGPAATSIVLRVKAVGACLGGHRPKLEI